MFQRIRGDADGEPLSIVINLTILHTSLIDSAVHSLPWSSIAVTKCTRKRTLHPFGLLCPSVIICIIVLHSTYNDFYSRHGQAIYIFFSTLFRVPVSFLYFLVLLISHVPTTIRPLLIDLSAAYLFSPTSLFSSFTTAIGVSEGGQKRPLSVYE